MVRFRILVALETTASVNAPTVPDKNDVSVAFF